MTLVPRLVLSLRSSGKEGVFSTRGACVAWNEGFLGERFTSVPLPKAWMAFPVGWREQVDAEKSGPPPSPLPLTIPAATFPVTAQRRRWCIACPDLTVLERCFLREVSHIEKETAREGLKQMRGQNRKKCL